MVSDADVAVSLELDKKLFDPVKAILVIGDLGNEQGSLDFLQVLHLFGGLSLPELCRVLKIHFLVEWELLDIDYDLGESGAQAHDPLHKWELVGEDLNLLAWRQGKVWLIALILATLVVIIVVVITISLALLTLLVLLLAGTGSPGSHLVLEDV